MSDNVLGTVPRIMLFDNMIRCTGERDKKNDGIVPEILLSFKATCCKFSMVANPLGNVPSIELLTATKFSSSVKIANSFGISPNSPFPSAFAIGYYLEG